MHSYAKRMMLFSVNEFLIGGDDDHDRGRIQRLLLDDVLSR